MYSSQFAKMSTFRTFFFFFCLIQKSISIEVCGTLGCLQVTKEEAELLKQPEIMDATGVPLNWTDPLDGWDLNKRLIFIRNAIRRLEYQVI